ncbi:uncharacterized protein A4U43_C04F290 [Asparagus officinalis]|uniref:Senescence regulator n=1 Tax=Asparagus officinalis TaxID=4686 RepID=A0A5P1F2L2_ASPOF|nr:uncharacterized protein A4U43_C04F290 [Asparagus officinalis]
MGAVDGEGSHGFACPTFDESDVVWGCSIEPRSTPTDSSRNKSIPSSRSHRKKSTEKGDRVVAAASLPVNIPDWSKILKGEYRGGNGNNNSYNNNSNSNSNGRLFGLDEGDGDDDDGAVTGAVIPPHELLWRNRAASFSVHEGIGRTLKGRDLSRVRNAIFQKTGFED